MNKKVLANVLLSVALHAYGAGVEVSSFQLINGVISDHAEDRSLAIRVTYESSKGLKKQIVYETKECQLTVPLTDGGRGISSIHVTEYYVGVPVAYDYYGKFTPDLIKKLSAGNIGLLVTKSGKEREDKTKELVFSFKDIKRAARECKDGG